MELRHTITDDQWDKIKDALPGKVGDRGRTAEDNRLFIDAVMWIAKTGAPWRDLPDAYGKWSTVHKRFIRWSKNGVWQMIFNTLAANTDTEWLWRKGGSNRRNLVDRKVGSLPMSTLQQIPWDVQQDLFLQAVMNRTISRQCR